MDNQCICCGKSGDLPVQALEVRTLHVRGISGERRVQALGNEISGTVCRSCAENRLELSRNAAAAARPQVIRFGIVGAAGILVISAALLFLNGQKVFLLLGLAAIICAVLGIYDALKKSKEKSVALLAMSDEEALGDAAWDVFTASSPRKEGSEDLTYIPINEKTLARKNGDLMILYGLLPEIAVQAWNRLHHQEKETTELS